MPRRIASMITSKMLHKLSIVSMHGHPLSRLTARLRVGDNYNTDGEKCKYRAKIPQAPTLDGSGGLWYNDNKGGFLRQQEAVNLSKSVLEDCRFRA